MDDRHPTMEFAAAMILAFFCGATGFILGYAIKAVLG